MEKLIPFFNEMLYELMGNQLEVEIIPNPRGEQNGSGIRVAVAVNTEWYRELCANYPGKRVRKNMAPDTKIGRKNITRVLSRLAEGKGSTSKYVPDLVAVAQNRLDIIEQYDVPFNNQF